VKDEVSLWSVAWPRAPLSRFIEEALYKCPESMNGVIGSAKCELVGESMFGGWTGASIPQSQWCMFPLFRISPLFPKISESGKISPTFSKFFYISSAKLFLVSNPEFVISLTFSQKTYISPLFWEIYYFPLFSEIPLLSVIIRLFSSILYTCFFLTPTLTMMHLRIHTMHVLDAPESGHPHLN